MTGFLTTLRGGLLGRELVRAVLKPLVLAAVTVKEDLAAEMGLLGEISPILATFTPTFVAVISLGLRKLVLTTLLLLGDILFSGVYLLFLAETGFGSINEFFFLISD
jgi:hypothetical protein